MLYMLRRFIGEEAHFHAAEFRLNHSLGGFPAGGLRLAAVTARSQEHDPSDD
jgi:hypothetical protein